MLLPRVLSVARAEGGVDAAGGEHGVRIELRPLTDQAHFDASLSGGYRGAPAGRPRADD
jgi:hypothetical protein